MVRRESPHLTFHPLTAKRWPDLERLFGPPARGACGGCWCMVWRSSHADFERRKGSGNKRAFKRIVTRGDRPGVIAYAQGEPIGWCSVGPREAYPFLERSRVLQRVDDEPVWSISCLFVARSYRQSGVSVELIKAATRFAAKSKAKFVEAYPHDPKGQAMAAAFAWTGLASAFQTAGFTEVARRSKSRPIMRIAVTKGRG